MPHAAVPEGIELLGLRVFFGSKKCWKGHNPNP